MLPVTSGSYNSGRDKSVLSTAIKQLKRRFGRRLRRTLRKHRFLLGGIAFAVVFIWWLTRAVRPVVAVVWFSLNLETSSITAGFGHSDTLKPSCVIAAVAAKPVREEARWRATLEENQRFRSRPSILALRLTTILLTFCCVHMLTAS